MINKKLIEQRSKDVINTNAIITDISDFLATHVPFKKLKYCPSGVSDDISNYYSEDKILEEFILDKKDQHNFLIVQGDNGSGKSHFIRWLKYKYDNEFNDESEVSIIIERENNTLQGTIKQLLQSDIIKKYVSQEQLNKLNLAENSISTDKFLTMINSNFTGEIFVENDDECILKKKIRKKLFAFLNNEIVMRELTLCEGGPIYRIGHKISNKDAMVNLKDDVRFTVEDFTFTITSNLMQSLKKENTDRSVQEFAEDLIDNRRNVRETIVQYLNDKMDKVIQESIKLTASDFKDIIDRIRVELKKANKNLTFFIEDITSFTGIDRAFIENLTNEHSKTNGLCRLTSIVGITNGYYEKSFPSNVKDRVTGRIIIDNESIFENNDAVLQITGRYINAIYISKDELNKWREKEAVDSELPLVKPIREWATYHDQSGRSFNIYPFSTKSILNLYYELETKTPRRFINEVLSPVLSKFTEENSKFPQGVQELSGFLRIPGFKKEFYNTTIDSQVNSEERERIKSLLRIYGDGSIDTFVENNIKYIGGVEEAIFDEFDVPKITGTIVENKSFQSTTNFINLEKVEESKSLNQNVQNYNHSLQDKSEQSAQKHVPVKPSKNQSVYENIVRYVKAWQNEGEALRSHEKIRDYIISFLLGAIDWQNEGVSKYIIKDTINRNSIIIEGQNTISYSEKNAFIIKRNEENYYFILALIDYNILGEKKWIFDDAGNDIIIVSAWLENNKSNIIKFVKDQALEKEDIYSIALLNNYYFNALSNNESITKSKNLYSTLLKKDIKFNYDNFKKILKDRYIDFNKYTNYIKENNEYIIRYYNCVLGESNSTSTNVFYLNASEILSRIEVLSSNKWVLESKNNLETGLKKLLFFNELYKELYLNIIPKSIEEEYKTIINVVEEYENIIGQEADIKEFTTQVNNLFINLRESHLTYNSQTEINFNKFYIEYYKVDKVIETLVEGSKRDMIAKIDRLKSNIVDTMNSYLRVIKSISKLVDENYKSNQSKSEFLDEEENFRRIKENTMSSATEMIEVINHMSGGNENVNE